MTETDRKSTDHLTKELDTARAELAVINTVQTALASNLNLPEIYTLVGDTISDITGAGVVLIASWDWQARILRADYFQEKGTQLGPIERPLSALHDAIFPELEEGKTIVWNEGIAEKYQAFGHEITAGNIPKSSIAVPLKIGGKIKSSIMLQDTEREFAFGESTIRLIETLAGSMSVALENAYLFDETRRLLKETEERNAELAVINSVQEGLVSNLDMQAIYDLVGEKISEITGSEIVVINTWNSETKMIRYEYIREKGERFDTIERPFTPLNEINIPDLERGETLNRQSGLKEALKSHKHSIPVGEMPKSVVTIPIRTGNKIRTAVSLQDTQREHAFSESTIQLVETLARSMGMALENARLFDETTQRNAELAIVNSVSEAMTKDLDVQTVVNIVGDQVQQIFDADMVGIGLINEEQKIVNLPYTYVLGEYIEGDSYPLGAGVSGRMFETRQPLLLNTREELDALNAIQTAADQTTEKFIQSWLGVPIIIGEKLIGGVAVQSYKTYAYDESDQRLLSTLATNMGTVIENARLFEETTHLLKETEERNAELAVINSVQEGLASQLDMPGIYKLVGDRISKITGAAVVLIGTWDWQTRMMKAEYFRDQGELYEGFERPLSPLHDAVFPELELGKTVVVNEGIEEYYKKIGHVVAAGKMPKTNIGVPLKIAGKINAFISLQDTENEFAFSESTIRLVETLAGNMGIALENAMLFAEVQSTNLEITEALERETASNEILQVIAESPTDIKPVLDVIAQNAAQLSGSEDVIIATKEGDMLKVVSHYGDIPMIPIGEGIHYDQYSVAGRAMIECKPYQAIHNQEGVESEFPEGDNVAKKYGYRSSSAVPLIREGQAVGVITIRQITPELLSEKQIALIQSFANQAAIAIENVRLFNETQRLLKETEERNAELAVINSVQEALAAQLDLQGIYDAVGDKIQEIFDAQSLVILTLDHQLETVNPKYFYENGKRHLPESFPFTGLIEHLINTGDKIVINENLDEWSEKFNMITEGEESKSGVWIPFKTGGEVRGIVSLQNTEMEHAFSNSDVRLLETLANSMSIALENARLFEVERQRAAEFSVISKVSQALVAEPEMDKMIQLIGSQAKSIFKADIAYLALLNPHTNIIEFPYQFGDDFEPLPFGQGLTSTILKSGEPLILNRNMDEHSSALGVSRIGRRALSFLGVPIKSGKETIGVLSVQNVVEEGAFDDDDLRLLTTIAANAGAAIHTAQLHAETQRRASEMATLAEIGNDIASTRDLDSTLRKIAERAKKLLNVGDIALYLMDETGEKIVPRVVLGEYVNEIMAATIPIGMGISGMVVKNGVAELVNDPSKHTSTITVPGTPEIEEEPEGLMSAPLISGGKAIGLINVWRKHKLGLFSESELEFLISVARQTAIAIDSARLYLETEHHAEQMSTLESVGREISSDLDLQSVLERIGERALNLLKGRSMAIRLLDPDNVLLPVVALGENADKYMDHRIELGKGITGNAAQTGKAEIINHPLEDDRLKLVPGTGQVDTQALIISPLTISDSVIGTLSIWRDKSIHGSFNDSDLGFAIGLARQAAIAITNANLFKEVERQKEYFEALISSAPVAIITIDLDGCVTGWSPAAVSLFGYTEKEAIGENIDDLVSNHPDVREEAEKYTQHYLNDLGKIQLKSQRTHKDGRLIDVAINAMPVLIDGEVSGYIAIYNDVSELEKARRDAEEANHAKSAFLANMSHELRTPLNAIIGFTRIVKRKGESVLPEKQIENLDKVLVSAEHLLGLINTVLDISKIEAGRMEVHATNFDLKSLVSLVASTAQPLLKNGKVSFKVNIPDDLPAVKSDIEKIKQVLINLVSNAAKFTHEGEINLTVRKVEDQIEIDVADTGIGISPEALQYIFEEFQQADSSTTREYGGTGLGLSISRSLARLLEGDLRVTSELGVGSTFTFTFPFVYGQKEELITSQPSQTKTDGDAPLILVIDDNEDAIYLMREMLENAGYRVAVARDGNEGLSLAGELAPYAITLDIMMPKKDGWQVLHDLKANPVTKSIPVILISIVDQKALGYRLGAEDYLVKPLQEDEILNSLQQIKRRSGNKPLKKLLVVDDDPMVKDMIAQLLEGKPYDIQSASDGLDALEKIKVERPDAILLDLMMPRLDGFGLIDRLKQDPELADLPVIVLTAKLLNQREQEALRKSAGQVIQKQGISGEQLLGEIRETIRKTV